MSNVEFRNLVKQYGGLQVVHGIDLFIEDGEFVVLVGPSGCGKSTSLRMLAGLETITGGEILVGGRVVNEMEPRDRDIAMVFQDYALYPHLSVYENMAFSLRYRGAKKDEIKRRVAEAAEILNLTDLLDRRPKQLSGGQRQRVAMGRAIVRKPQVFLFDEPLSNLDAKLRGSMRLEIKKLHRKLGVTTVHVTHDQVEAMTLADRVVVMNSGNIEQVGTPDEVYHQPRTQFVAGFIGSPTMNFLPAKSDGTGGYQVCGARGFRLASVPDAAAGIPELVFGIRSEDISVATGEPEEGHAIIECVTDVVEALGPDTLIFADHDGHSVTARVKQHIRPRPDEPVRFSLNLGQAHLFNPETGRAVR